MIDFVNMRIMMIFAYVSVRSPGTSTKHFHCSSSPYFWLSVSSNILNMAIGHTHSLDTAVHGYGIRQSMISRLSMDLRRERKVWGWDRYSSAQGKYSMNTHYLVVNFPVHYEFPHLHKLEVIMYSQLLELLTEHFMSKQSCPCDCGKQPI